MWLHMEWRQILNIIKRAFLPLLLSQSLFGAIRVTSEKAHYSDEQKGAGARTLILEGKVRIEDGQATLSGQKAILEAAARDDVKEIPFSTMSLEGQVELVFVKEGKRFEARADLLEGDLKSGRFVFRGIHSPLSLQSDSTTVLARWGELFCEEREGGFELKALHLYEEIRIERSVQGMQYALADRLDYFPEEDQLMLVSQAAPVLFVDEAKGVTISASKIIAKSGGERIEGVGQVQFTFKEDEIKRIEEQFSWTQKSY